MEDISVKYADFVRQNEWSSRHFYDWPKCEAGQVVTVELLDLAADLGPGNARAVRKDAANRIVMAAASRARAAKLKVTVVSRKPWHSVVIRFDQP